MYPLSKELDGLKTKEKTKKKHFRSCVRKTLKGYRDMTVEMSKPFFVLSVLWEHKEGVTWLVTKFMHHGKTPFSAHTPIGKLCC